MTHLLRLPVLLVTLAMLATACTGDPDGTPAPDSQAPAAHDRAQPLTVYSRYLDGIEPLFEQFEQQTGTTVRVRWGDPIDLAEQIIADGDDSPADVFYGPLSDALGSLNAAGRLATLPDDQLDRVSETYRSPEGTWAGTDGRAHVVFYNTDQLSADDLPDSILGFTDAVWGGRIGWDPTSRSLHSVVAALSQRNGEDEARAWLQGIQANDPAVFAGAEPIIHAVAAGEIIDVGFGSHPYVYTMRADGDADNVAAKYYPGDPGGLLNPGGVGIIDSTANPAAANTFVDFMLSLAAQHAHAAGDTFEIPLVNGGKPPEGIPTADQLTVRGLDMQQFEELRDARRLLTEAGSIK